MEGFIGVSKDGAALSHLGQEDVGLLEVVGPYLLIAFVLNFVLIYRGISGGIELFCKVAVPTLVVLAVIVLIRVLTLGAPVPSEPAENVNTGSASSGTRTRPFSSRMTPPPARKSPSAKWWTRD